MKRLKISNNFYLDELIDVHSFLMDPDNGFNKLDPVIIDCLQLLRVKLGKPINVNTWWPLYTQLVKEGKSNEQIIELIETSQKVSKFSGFRPAHCKIGAKHSAHKKGQAVDPKGNEMKLFRIVKNNAAEFYNMGLRRIENPSITPGWLHMDTNEKNHKPGFIRVINQRSHAFDIDAT